MDITTTHQSVFLDSCLASPPPPPLPIRGPVYQLTALQPGVHSAPTGWQRCSGPGPAWTVGSGSSCWSTCHLTPPALELRRSTHWWPPLVAVDRETHRRRQRFSGQIMRLWQQNSVSLQEETEYEELIYRHMDIKTGSVQRTRDRTNSEHRITII